MEERKKKEEIEKIKKEEEEKKKREKEREKQEKKNQEKKKWLEFMEKKGGFTDTDRKALIEEIEVFFSIYKFFFIIYRMIHLIQMNFLKKKLKK